jgi:hypothetical protein
MVYQKEKIKRIYKEERKLKDCFEDIYDCICMKRGKIYLEISSPIFSIFEIAIWF